MRPFLLATALLATAAFAADLPAIPAESIAKKKELLFSDDFKPPPHAKEWQKVVDPFPFKKGALKAPQPPPQNIPPAAGKPAVTAHAAVYGLEIPTKDSVV